MLKQLFGSLRGNAAARLNEQAIALWQRGDLPAAERVFRSAIDANRAYAPAHSNLGMVLWEQRRLDEAIVFLGKAVELDPRHVGARINLGNALAIGERMVESVGQYREALALQPDDPGVLANMLKPLLDLCDWDASERLVAGLVARWRERAQLDAVLDSISPFPSLLVDVPQAMRLEIARRASQRIAARIGSSTRPPRAPHAGGRRLRIGYASADFHDHATAHLAAGVFEMHDRERFEAHAYSFGIDDASESRRRMRAAFEHFVDLRAAPHDAIARRIAADGIDILVDMKGHTGEGRPEVFALRPAPVQVSWLGYPGTTGADFIDYVVADRIVIPPDAAAGFSEQVAWLPASYQPNDDRLAISPRAMARAEFGLPQHAFVYCAFNQHCKIERTMFDAWLRILAAAPESVLWLTGGHGEGALKTSAMRAGVAPGRIVFAARLPKAEHLARHRLADLYLDTHTCNAHTTASDALWAGLPVLTWPGDAFAGRVAASLSHAAGLPELVVASLAEYERIALELAHAPQRLRDLRERLAANRLHMPLFRTADYARKLEAAYTSIWQRHSAGLPPASFEAVVPPSAPG